MISALFMCVLYTRKTTDQTPRQQGREKPDFPSRVHACARSRTHAQVCEKTGGTAGTVEQTPETRSITGFFCSTTGPFSVEQGVEQRLCSTASQTGGTAVEQPKALQDKGFIVLVPLFHLFHRFSRGPERACAHVAFTVP